MTIHYGNETAPLLNPAAHVDYHYDEARHIGTLDWTDARLAKVTRLRLLTDPGHPVWDVSYCQGVTTDGHTCDVALPFSTLPKKGRNRAIVQHAIRDGVHAKRLGLLDNQSCLW